MQGKSKKKLAYDIKIREALEIRRHNCGPGKGLNEDMGSYVKTDIWDPELRTIDKCEHFNVNLLMWTFDADFEDVGEEKGGGGPALSWAP